MKYKFITASILLALSASAAAAGPRMERIIDRLDTDGDGQISREEFSSHTPPRGGMVEHADVNGDGQVTMEELRQRHAERMAERMAEQAQRRQERAENMEERFAATDLNGDGAVTAEEAREAAFAHMDTNGDGFLSTDEFRPPRHAARGHFPKHRRPFEGSPE